MNRPPSCAFLASVGRAGTGGESESGFSLVPSLSLSPLSLVCRTGGSGRDGRTRTDGRSRGIEGGGGGRPDLEEPE